jgi:uracil phosphoribosyltransferase
MQLFTVSLHRVTIFTTKLEKKLNNANYVK